MIIGNYAIITKKELEELQAMATRLEKANYTIAHVRLNVNSFRTYEYELLYDIKPVASVCKQMHATTENALELIDAFREGREPFR